MCISTSKRKVAVFNWESILRNLILLCSLVLLVSCKKSVSFEKSFTIDCINKYTPVKNQGKNNTCWIYGMLSTIESNHLALGDSVHLSPYFIARNFIIDQTDKYCQSNGRMAFTMRATALTAIRLLNKYGAMPYDSYHRGNKVNFTVLAEQGALLAQHALRKSESNDVCRCEVTEKLDQTLGYPANNVFMLGAQYTPQEFSRSVCAPDEYIGLTSYIHHPFYVPFSIEVPDNGDNSQYYNIPIQQLTDLVRKTVKGGYSVCWEGDVSEDGFSFEKGVAVMTDMPKAKDIQERRQRDFENEETTDDHCMSIIGIAHDKSGTEYFIMKNSWGTNNPYDGLVYMSVDYFKMKTIAVVLSKAYLQSTDHPHLRAQEQYIYFR